MAAMPDAHGNTTALLIPHLPWILHEGSVSCSGPLSLFVLFLDEYVRVNNVTQIHCEINQHAISVHRCLHISIFFS